MVWTRPGPALPLGGGCARGAFLPLAAPRYQCLRRHLAGYTNSMTSLRMVRLLTNLLMWGAVATGVWALFAGEWVILTISVVAFFGIGLVFANANQGIDQITRSNASGDADRIAALIHAGDWDGAVAVSNRAVKELSETVRVGGKASENRGPLAVMLILQSALLGASGDTNGAWFASNRAVSLLEKVESPTPHGQELLQRARELRANSSDQRYCARTVGLLMAYA